MVGWDGADWQMAKPLLSAGKMPQLAELCSGGARAAIESLPPYLSPMLWNTIATGKHPAEHGVLGFTEIDPSTGELRPCSSHSRKVKALWNILSQKGLRTHVFGWFASHPAERLNGVCVAETFAKFSPGTAATPPPAGSVHPPEMMELLADLRATPGKLDPNILRFFLPLLDEIDLKKDPRPKRLLERLAELYTLHNASVATLRDDPAFNFLAVYYHFLDWICHDFIEFAPPRRPEISEEDYARYSGVVARAYELQDLLLRDLLAAAPAGTACMVVSDHGFLSGAERPAFTPQVPAGIAAWHRRHGLFAFAGPGIRAGSQVPATNLLDVAPTVLRYFGLPQGQDMSGRALDEIFAEHVEAPAPIASWEQEGPPLSNFQSEAFSDTAAAALLRQFEDLGYVDRTGEAFESAEVLTQRENAWNLGQSLFHAGRAAEALPHLERAYFECPEVPHYALPLAQCQARLGLHQESQTTAQTLLDYAGEPRLNRVLAELNLQWGRAAEALLWLEADSSTERAADEQMRELRARVLLRLERWEEAEALLRTLDAGDNRQLLLCRARALMGMQELKTAHNLLQALVERWPSEAMGWFLLGQVRHQRTQHEDAKAAFTRALELKPDFTNARLGWIRQSLKTGATLKLDDEAYHAPVESLSDQMDREIEERCESLRTQSAARFEGWRKAREQQRDQASLVTMLEPRRSQQERSNAAPIAVVSGLPRSGTSLMMQMLTAGGIPGQVDAQREADMHNPQGYYEWEPIKTLQKQPRVIGEACGKVVKVVSLQLPHLLRGYPYRVVWMDRPVKEIAHSQSRMLAAEREGAKPSTASEAQLQQHRNQILGNLRAWAQSRNSNLQLLEVAYADCIQDPAGTAQRIAAFLHEWKIDPKAMAATVKPDLYRVRSQAL